MMDDSFRLSGLDMDNSLTCHFRTISVLGTKFLLVILHPRAGIENVTASMWSAAHAVLMHS